VVRTLQLARGFVLFLGGGHPDAQVHPLQVVVATAQELLDLGEHAIAQIVALRLHVEKCAADE
jgi:hypothetical protein